MNEGKEMTFTGVSERGIAHTPCSESAMAWLASWRLFRGRQANANEGV
jgi:hypothetical protein